jgi:hypothetical protein
MSETLETNEIRELASVSLSHPFLADVYTFNWTELNFRVPLTCSLSVALCLLIGLLAHHPGAALIAGGGAATVGFGVNQRIADSRLSPMLGATFAMFLSTIIGMLVGHRGAALLIAVAMWSFFYGVLTMRAPGIGWVGQQAAVILIVTSAFPADFHHALERGLLMLAGGGMQLLITTLFLHLLPELRSQLSLIRAARHWPLRHIPHTLPQICHALSMRYALRLAITVTLAAEVYRRLGVKSGYWIPMTALLVQKPAFSETLTRALMRVAGTLAGAVVTTLFLTQVHPSSFYLAGLAVLFAFLGYATNSVNYALFSACLTSYIVFLLSLNEIPGPVIAHRRAVSTLTGGLIALFIHLDALHRQKKELKQTQPAY